MHTGKITAMEGRAKQLFPDAGMDIKLRLLRKLSVVEMKSVAAV
jgi:hypothetical protein